MISRKLFLWFVVGGAALFSVVFLTWYGMVAATETPGSGKLPPLVLTIGWNGETFEVPPPPRLPHSAVNNLEYQYYRWPGRWLHVGTTLDLAAKDSDGRRYQASVNTNFVLPARRVDPVRWLRVYRPDGTLEAEASEFLVDEEIPMAWVGYAPDGVTKKIKVRLGHSSPPIIVHVREIVFYDEDGDPVRRYHANRYGVIDSEDELDREGKRVRRLNGSNDLNDARPEDIPKAP